MWRVTPPGYVHEYGETRATRIARHPTADPGLSWERGASERLRMIAAVTAEAHLREADPMLGAILDALGPDDPANARDGRPDDHYGALVRAIVGQQLSTKAARSIYGRLDSTLRRPRADAGGDPRRRP